MKVNKIEFNKFWDEVLGNDWYIDDDDFEFDDDECDEIVLGDATLAYQGGRKIKLPDIIKKSEFDEDVKMLTVGLETLFRRWKKSQTHVTFVMHFTVEKDKENDLRKKLQNLVENNQ